MISVKGVYDGKNVKFLEKPHGIKSTTKAPREVIVTFLDDDGTIITPMQRKNLAKSKKEIARGNYSNFVKLQDI